MLASEIIYNIKNLQAGGVQSDDTNLSDRQVAFIIDYYRAKLMREEYMRHGRIDRENVQDLGRVALIQADPHECDCPSYSCVLRTALQIPKSLHIGRKHGFTFVGTYGGKSWQEETWQSASWTAYAKYTGNQTKWLIKNKYIYILNPEDSMIEYLNIQGLFEDPRKANKFRTCDCDNEEECNIGYHYEYPISVHLVDTVVKMVINSELRSTLILPTDTSNDSMDTNTNTNARR